MKNFKRATEEQMMASKLRRSVLEMSQVKYRPEVNNLNDIELISEVEKPYISPIMTMNEDEILAFVEEFDVNELATLSVAELNRIGEVLGVDPTILAGVEDI